MWHIVILTSLFFSQIKTMEIFPHLTGRVGSWLTHSRLEKAWEVTRTSMKTKAGLWHHQVLTHCHRDDNDCTADWGRIVMLWVCVCRNQPVLGGSPWAWTCTGTSPLSGPDSADVSHLPICEHRRVQTTRRWQTGSTSYLWWEST